MHNAAGTRGPGGPPLGCSAAGPGLQEVLQFATAVVAICNVSWHNRPFMRTFTFATSLRQKITAAYALIGLLILIVSLFTIEELPAG